MIERFGRTLPFSCQQAFDIAADIERYPEFLRWWISARIQKRESNICYVEQVLGLGPILHVLHHRTRLVSSGFAAAGISLLFLYDAAPTPLKSMDWGS
jgi:hypothetical protein